MDGKDDGSHTLLYRFRIGRYELDEARCELRLDGVPVKVEPKPRRVLSELLRHPNEVVTREHLRATVWNRRPTVEQAMNNVIVKLRRAFGEYGKEDLTQAEGKERVIETVGSVGYKWVAPVEREVVGRRLCTSLDLKPNEPVHGRRDVVLESPLHVSPAGETWLAKHVASAQHRLFKFSRNGAGVEALKREAEVLETLHEGLGARGDLVQLLRRNFEKPPFYLETQYAGVDLATWASGGSLAALSADQRLRLFLQIAAAVQAAHGVNVLHGDLKPANVLIVGGANDAWLVRLANFGKARLLECGEPENLTDASHDPAFAEDASADSLYQAPEVRGGQPASIRSEVYALGVMLYQLMTGNLQRRLETNWQSHVSSMLLCEDIVAATAELPEARLASVGELMKRLQSLEVREEHRLQAEANALRAVQMQQALHRVQARRPYLIALISSLVIGLGSCLWLYSAESAARHDSERQGQRLRAVNLFFNDVLRVGNPNAPGGGANVTIGEALDRARSKLDVQFIDDPVTKGSLYATLGEAYFGLGKYEVALTMQQQAAPLFASELGPGHETTLTVQYQTVLTLDVLTRNREARELLERANRAAGARLRGNSMLALLAHVAGGSNALAQMQPARARMQFEAAEAVRQLVVPNDADWLVRVRANIAWCDVRTQRYAEALQALEPLMAAEYTPQRIGVADWAKVHLQYALALSTLRRYPQAEQVTRDAIEGIRREVGPKHYLVGLGWNHLAAVMRAQARWDRALGAARLAHQIFRDAMGERSRSTLAALGDLAVLEYLSTEGSDSIVRLAAAHSEIEYVLGAASPVTQYVDFHWAHALLDVGIVPVAADLFESIDAAALEAMDPCGVWDLRLQGLKARIMLGGDHKSEARQLLKLVIDKLSEREAESSAIAPLRRALKESSPSSVGATTATRST